MNPLAGVDEPTIREVQYVVDKDVVRYRLSDGTIRDAENRNARIPFGWPFNELAQQAANACLSVLGYEWQTISEGTGSYDRDLARFTIGALEIVHTER
ncbi:MAG TPA: hypothetical protein VNT30_09210 [Stellaceae bacterium]|nr:hypothetical protein [Stellaceae bacterium]